MDDGRATTTSILFLVLTTSRVHTFFFGGFHDSQRVSRCFVLAHWKWERKRIPDGFGGDAAEDRPGIEVVARPPKTFNPLEIIVFLGQMAIGGTSI